MSKISLIADYTRKHSGTHSTLYAEIHVDALSKVQIRKTYFHRKTEHAFPLITSLVVGLKARMCAVTDAFSEELSDSIRSQLQLTRKRGHVVSKPSGIGLRQAEAMVYLSSACSKRRNSVREMDSLEDSLADNVARETSHGE